MSVSGTLGGIGTIGGVTTVNSGGIIAPWQQHWHPLDQQPKRHHKHRRNRSRSRWTGTLDTTDLLALGSGVFDLSAPGDIISFSVTGALTGASYTLATYGSVSGIFDTITALPSGYQLDYRPTRTRSSSINHRRARTEHMVRRRADAGGGRIHAAQAPNPQNRASLNRLRVFG